jgi:hypothetical protein
MVFGLFEKKKEVVDYRPKDSDMPIPAKMREKLMGTANPVASTYVPDEETSPTSAIPPVSNSGGGFFGFFGGGSDNSNSNTSSSTTTAASETQPASTQVDFWGNPVNNESSSSESSSSNYPSSKNVSSQLSDIIYRLGGITDRLELVEKKMDRLERRTLGNNEHN